MLATIIMLVAIAIILIGSLRNKPEDQTWSLDGASAATPQL